VPKLHGTKKRRTFLMGITLRECCPLANVTVTGGAKRGGWGATADQMHDLGSPLTKNDWGKGEEVSDGSAAVRCDAMRGGKESGGARRWVSTTVRVETWSRRSGVTGKWLGGVGQWGAFGVEV